MTSKKTELLISEALDKIYFEHKDKITIDTIVLKSPGGTIATWVLRGMDGYGRCDYRPNATELLNQLRNEKTYTIPFTINDRQDGELVFSPTA